MVKAVFVFASISFFDEIIEVITTDSLLFVNTVSEIVHSNVEKYRGAPNKSIGEAFLLVWKEDEFSQEGGGTMKTEQ